MNRRFAKRLYDAKLASERIEQFAHGRALVDLATDDYFGSAISWQLATLERTLNALDLDDLRPGQTLLELRHATGCMRSIIQGYDAIQAQTIWDAIQNDVPNLRRQLDLLLRDGAPAIHPSESQADRGSP
jgi:uncharacterized protein with HEPN domain